MSPFHPSKEILQRFAAGGLSDAQWNDVARHIEECDECALLTENASQSVESVLRRILVREAPKREVPQTLCSGLPIDDDKEISSSRETFGCYELAECIGAGGMGRVYKAWHYRLKRWVALKLMSERFSQDQTILLRFRREAEAVAHLQHPNIVRIFDFGTIDNQPYCAFELIEGGTLEAYMKHSRMTPVLAAQMASTMAGAMYHAHQRGILHRDLKPANILLNAHKQPLITDFGLARRLDDDFRQTESGMLLGTALAMSPEQAEGRHNDVDVRSDLYAIGTILYEMLTGKSPSSATTLAETLRRVIAVPPEPVRKLNPAVPLDLETICLKCLEKNPASRYSDCRELEAELTRFLDGIPILARPISLIHRLLRWGRRRPAMASLLGLAMLSSVLAVAGTALYTRDLSNANQKLEAELNRSQRNEYALRLQDIAAKNEFQPGEAQAQLNDVVCFPDGIRDFCWRYLADQCRRELGRTVFPAAIRSIDLSPDQKQLVVGCEDGTCFLTDAKTLTVGSPVARHAAPITAVRFTDKGSHFLTSGEGGTVLVTDCENASTSKIFELPGERINCLTQLPRSQNFVSGASDHRLRVHDGETGEVLRTLEGHLNSIYCISIDHSGKQLVSGSRDGALKLWNLEDGTLMDTQTAHSGLFVTAASFDRYSQRLVTTGDDGHVVVWNCEAGKLVELSRERFSGRGRIAVWSQDGTSIVAASTDDIVRILRCDSAPDLEQQERTDSVDASNHQEGVQSDMSQLALIQQFACEQISGLSISDNGTAAFLCGQNNVLQCVSLKPAPYREVRFVDAPGLTMLFAVADSDTVVARDYDGKIRIFEADGELLTEHSAESSLGNLLASATNKPVVAWDDVFGTVHIARVADGEVRVISKVNADSLLTGLELSADGSMLATFGNGDTGLKVYDLRSGTHLEDPSVQDVAAVSFSPVKPLLAVADRARRIRILNPDGQMREAAAELILPDVVQCLAWSIDGRRIAVGTAGSGYILDAASNKILVTLPIYNSRWRSMIFGSDVLVSTHDDAIRFWDPLIGVPRLTVSMSCSVRSAAFVENEETLVAATSIAGLVRLSGPRSGIPGRTDDVQFEKPR